MKVVSNLQGFRLYSRYTDNESERCRKYTEQAFVHIRNAAFGAIFAPERNQFDSLMIDTSAYRALVSIHNVLFDYLVVYCEHGLTVSWWLWLLLSKQRRMPFKLIKRQYFCWQVARNNAENNSVRHKIQQIFSINCFVLITSLTSQTV